MAENQMLARMMFAKLSGDWIGWTIGGVGLLLSVGWWAWKSRKGDRDSA